VVDASQGVEAQSVANCYTAIEQDLEVLPVLNKIDLPAADPDRVAEEIEEVIGLDATEAVHVSAKTGVGIKEVLEQLVAEVPAPAGDPEKPLQALIIDSWFQADTVGVFTPKRLQKDALSVGEVGFIIAGIKEIEAARVGDTITLNHNPADEALPGFKEVQPRVFAGMYPVDSDDYETLREALQKLRLNDAALHFEPETSSALGFGFRCGFLGMLHMEIVQERLEREYNLDLISTAPTVIYEIVDTKGEITYIHNPSQLPPVNELAEIREPIIRANLLLPQDYVGEGIKLCIEKRGVQVNMQYMGRQVSMSYELPLSEVVLDFFDRLKSCSRGYASFDYEFVRFQAANLVKVDLLINGDKVDALASIVHKDRSTTRGRELAERMKEIIPRQMFEVAVQAAIGTHIISRSTIKALRKNVTAKCYGGDVSRKRKLLEKQKAGKRRMKQVGKVEIPQEAFLAVLQVDRG